MLSNVFIMHPLGYTSDGFNLAIWDLALSYTASQSERIMDVSSITEGLERPDEILLRCLASSCLRNSVHVHYTTNFLWNIYCLLLCLDCLQHDILLQHWGNLQQLAGL